MPEFSSDKSLHRSRDRRRRFQLLGRRTIQPPRHRKSFAKGHAEDPSRVSKRPDTKEEAVRLARE